MRRLLIALVLCLLASPVLAQVEAPTVTTSQGTWTIGPNRETLLDGVQIASGAADSYLWDPVAKVIYCHVTQFGANTWYRLIPLGWENVGSDRPTLAVAPAPPPVPAPLPPVVTINGGTFCVGDAPRVIVEHDGVNTTSYALSQNGAVVQTKDRTAIVSGAVTFTLAPFTTAGHQTVSVSAVNAQGATPSASVVLTVVDALTAVVKGWPAGPSGSRSFSYQTNHTLASVSLTWPLKAVFTDVTGCTVTVTK